MVSHPQSPFCSQPMYLAHISDTHIAANGLAAGRRERELERTMAALNALSPAPIAIIHTGDVAHNGRPAEYEIAQRHLTATSRPLVLAVGNRDDRPPMRAAFPALDREVAERPFIQYVRDLGPVRIVVADTMANAHGLGELCAARLADLSALIEGAEPPVVIALHHPPVGVASLHFASQFRNTVEADALVKLIARKSGVIGVLAGHIHREDVAPVGATHLSTATSIAVDLRKGRYSAEARERPICHLHEIGPHGLRSRRLLVDLDPASVAGG